MGYGATGSVITPALARSLGLVSTGRVPMAGVHGEKKVNTYVVECVLPPDVVFKELYVSSADLAGSADVLIGMDIIGAGDFSICGGQFFSYCVPSFENPIDFVEKAERVNKRIVKQNRKESLT